MSLVTGSPKFFKSVGDHGKSLEHDLLTAAFEAGHQSGPTGLTIDHG